MSQEGAEKKLRACPERMDSKKQSLEAKAYCRRKKGGPFYSSISNPELLLVHF
jgi:hypothetical protein